AIAEGTAKIADRYRERVAEATKGRLRGRLAIEKRRLEKLRATLKNVPEERLRGLSKSQLRRALRQAKWLSKAMTQDDLAQALKMAQRLNASLELLALDLDGHRFRAFLWRPPQRANVQQVRRAQKLAAQIRDGIEAALPRPSGLLSPASKRRLQSLQARQRALAERAKRLREKLRRGDGAALGAGLPRGLKAAEKLMRDARKKLASHRPQRAHSAEMSAAGKLAGLRKSMRRARQPRQSGRTARRQRIKIPGADAFKATRAFRKDIMDAMKEKAPATYEKPVRRYYHELVR
ncbi:MAG: hypothetical protein KAI47_22820, partial [Deltaproteobacteria bacterium]|nr:hypothetical protein [Deltaproteobacteria bacterium]